MSDEKIPVIILAGWSCAEKSTIAKKISELIGFDLISVYEVYRAIAISKGYKRSREWLENVGSNLFAISTFTEIADQMERKLRFRDVFLMSVNLESTMKNSDFLVTNYEAIENVLNEISGNLREKEII